MAPGNNGGTTPPPPVTLSITFDPSTNKCRLEGPLDRPDQCLQLCQMAIGQLFGLVAGVAQAKRSKVKTLDELGVGSHLRLQ